LPKSRLTQFIAAPLFLVPYAARNSRATSTTSLHL
jgi:hypothetical protein